MGKKIITALICAAFAVCLPLAACNKPSGDVLGVWWWSDELGDEYLDFAKDNGVTEIYYCSDKFNADTQTFIGKAAAKNIDVYHLTGDYRWIENPAPLFAQMDKYSAYQRDYSNCYKGVHFDIEPHQHPEFSARRGEIITAFVELTYELKERYPDVRIAYDLPFWLDDEVTAHGIKKPAYRHIIDNAYKVTLMSYRDTAEAIYNVSEEEITYAQATGKTINLGVETKSNEGDFVSFQEEGKAYMYAEIAKLREMLPDGYGVVIHHIKQWYDLKD